MVAKISVAVWQDTILYDSFVVTSKVQVNEFIFLMRIILMSNNSNTSSYINTDQDIFEKFKERAMSDLDGAWNSVLVYIGDKLGLYKAMNDAGKPITSQELANMTKTSERNIREWLANQAAGGYVAYDAHTQRYSLPSGNALALVDENSSEYIIGGFQTAASFYKDASKIIEVFKTGSGLPWGEHDPDLYQSVERFFRPSYRTNIASSSIPSLDNGRVQEKLKTESALVADVRCGRGISTIFMAKAYPNSKFIGFDNHEDSIKKTRGLAREEGLSEEQIKFETSSSTNYPPFYHEINQQYDLITFFDCLHDMGDPVGAASHTLESLKPDGTIMIVEPFANDKLEDNLNPLGRISYAVSTMVCVPASMAANGPALGTQAGEAKISQVM
jgi:SAM-dependent methyltransferase